MSQVAILHEGDEPGNVTEITYEDLLRRVCRVANAMKELGVKKGDFVTLYMPMVPDAAVAMLACARLGAPHSVVFAGFSAEALRDRIVVSSVRLCPGERIEEYQNLPKRGAGGVVSQISQAGGFVAFCLWRAGGVQKQATIVEPCTIHRSMKRVVFAAGFCSWRRVSSLVPFRPPPF